MEPLTCPACHFPISETFYFCPNCGKKLKEPPISVSLGKQIGIYALSVLLPPLGLWPGIKYMMQKDSKVQMVGLVTLVLTILSTVITIWYSVILFKEFNKTIGTQMNQTQQIDQLGL